jgi:NADPH:quinone reductase-like Zn-dependent oxidoreductase
MRALRLEVSGSPLSLVERDTPRPRPNAGELLIRVCAAGVTPTELFWYPTSHTKTGDPRRFAVPGHEFAGEIAEIGEGVSGFSVGQEVYGMNDWFSDGATAEYCVTKPESIAPKPRSVGHPEAASVPIGALTAWQGLYDRAKLQPGERVLVHGGAGSVGVFAIQLARLRGAHVIATASARNLDFIKQLGAERALDYHAAPFEDSVREMDIVFDTVGGDTLRRSWSVLGPDGRMVTIAAGADTGSEETKRAFFIVEPSREQLVEVARLVDAGDLRPVVDTVVPFSRAADAYTGSVDRKGRGKSVVQVA